MKQHLKNYGFTLVEIIVVIVILAILWTISFTSLQGYTLSARSAKVIFDVQSLSNIIQNSANQSERFSFFWLVDLSSNYWVPVQRWTFNAWVPISNATYHVGRINFPAIKQNRSDFTDPEGKDYVVAIIHENESDKPPRYQIVGQVQNLAGTYDAIIKWTYYKLRINDINGLVATTTYPYGVDSSSTNIPAPGIY